MNRKKKSPTSYPLTEQQAREAFRLALIDVPVAQQVVNFWEAHDRELDAMCWHWEAPDDDEKWGRIWMDFGHRVIIDQYTEARDTFIFLRSFSGLRLYKQIHGTSGRNSDEEVKDVQ